MKRLPVLIEAFEMARARATGPASLILVGGHPGEWEGEHPAAAIERLGARDVHLAGWHSHEELPDLLNAADALVHASVAEQFGQVLIEAMACGLPVIAVDRGGPSTIVDDGWTGRLVEPDDPEALAAAMVEAIEDPAERRAARPPRPRRGRRPLRLERDRPRGRRAIAPRAVPTARRASRQPSLKTFGPRRTQKVSADPPLSLGSASR